MEEEFFSFTNKKIENIFNKALDLIVDLGPDFICEKLHEYSEERKYCSENCQNLDTKCILRYLKYYENSKS